MKVLWFTNILMPAVLSRLGRDVSGSGHWMSSLLDALKARSDIELTVVTAVTDGGECDFVDDRIRYITFDVGAADRRPPTQAKTIYEQKALPIVHAVQPDVIHIHGTERPYGMLIDEKSLIAGIPAVISIQGLIKHVRKNSFGGLSLMQLLSAHSLAEIALFQGVIPSKCKFQKKEKMEHIMLQNASNVIGRTTWDREVVTGLNPSVRYFHVEEMMRPVFFRYEWSMEVCQPYSIIATSCRTPLRGTHDILKAMAALLPKYADIRLRLAGTISMSSGYGQYLKRLIKRLGIDDHVEFCGYLREDQLVDCLLRSNLFIAASHNENSPNSLCEAQLLGVPCLATEVGGIPSLIRHEKDGILVPSGDADALAGQIDRLFTHRDLMEKISTEGRKVARIRHDPAKIVDNIVNVYDEIKEGPAKS